MNHISSAEWAGTLKMPCPKCGEGKSRVIDSRNGRNNWQRRTRTCAKCHARWTTMEVPVEVLAALPRAVAGLRAARDGLTVMLDALDAHDLPEEC